VITPAEIRRKAENLYDDYLVAWLADEAFFPRSIPANRRLDSDDAAAAIAAMRELREGSKEVRGFGYTVEWRERRSRAFGRNPFPERIYFETPADLLRLIGKQREFATFTAAVERLHGEFPELNAWTRSHRQTLATVAAELDGLLHVLRYFREHPRPDRFVRELPLPVDSKFVERYASVLRDWFDIVLPPATIRADETHFERRYGLRYAEQHVLVRFLDDELRRATNCPWSELSLPWSTLAALQPGDVEVIVVENKVNLLTLPSRPRTIGFGGLGRAASELRRLPWLAKVPLTYWGDLDVEGFQILSEVRSQFPQTRSVLMDERTVERFRHLAVPGNGGQPAAPLRLTEVERKAFELCRDENLRIEQERLPHEL
jgi:hypothetical protein